MHRVLHQPGARGDVVSLARIDAPDGDLGGVSAERLGEGRGVQAQQHDADQAVRGGGDERAEIGALDVATGDPDHALGRLEGGRGGGGVGGLGVVDEADAVDGGEVLGAVGAHAVGAQAVAEGGFPPELLEKLATARTTGTPGR